MHRNNKRVILLVVVALFLVAILAASLPPIRDRLVWHLDQWRAQALNVLFPKDEVYFVPQDQVAMIVKATLSAMAPSPTPLPSATPQPQATPAATPTPLPAQVALTGVRYEDQHGLWNYCAPANLAMALSYWGWQGDRLDTGKVLKPYDDDLNVMPYEMASYVEDYTQLGVVVRQGGTITLLKQLVAAGYPVLIEKGVIIKEASTGQNTWMGHYSVITGYDDARQEFITQDSYYSPDYPIAYDEITIEWRPLNYVFLVIYPPERQANVFALLGNYADERTSDQIAAQNAANEVAADSGINQFFAWFNRGTSMVSMQDYYGAANAYDQAFVLLSSLPEDQIPKKVMRIVWYQTGPFFAYYYTGRYQDVIDLANTAIDLATRGPFLEESFYWRGRARAALGDTAGAIDDLQTSLKYHPDFPPSVELLSQMGVSN